jgi:hypothetical protein
LAKASVYMRERRGGDPVKHDVANGAVVTNQDGLLIIQSSTGLQVYFIVPMELVDHIVIEHETK